MTRVLSCLVRQSFPTLMCSNIKKHLNKFKYSHFQSTEVSQVKTGCSDRWLNLLKRKSNLSYRIWSIQENASTYGILRTVLGTGNQSRNIRITVLKRQRKEKKVRLKRVFCALRKGHNVPYGAHHTDRTHKHTAQCMLNYFCSMLITFHPVF